MGGGAWPLLVRGSICLVNSDNERDSSLLNSSLVFVASVNFLEGPVASQSHEIEQQQVCDALRCSGPHARYTEEINVRPPCPEGLGNPLNLLRAWDWGL